MNAKCKPGDLAVVINPELATNRGRILRVVSVHDQTGDLVFPSAYGRIWLVESAHPMTWRQDGKRYRRKRGPVPDHCLQPIRGNPAGRHGRIVSTEPSTTEKTVPLVLEVAGQ